jgi:hypothetical protein
MNLRTNWFPHRKLALLVGLIALSASTAFAQFSIPLPKAFPEDAVRLEDIRLLFLTHRGADGTYPNVEPDLRRRVNAMGNNQTLRAAFDVEAKSFCRQQMISDEHCTAGLHVDSLISFLGATSRRTLNEVYLKTWIPTVGYHRGQLSSFMRRSGADESIAFASQFSANISDKEAYVVSNLLRGLAGRLIFSADYALVVARSDSADPEVRDTIESDKANLLRAVNNGGTMVGRFAFPMYARSGATMANSAGLTISAGFLGPLAKSESPEGTQNAVISGSGEFLGSLSVRDLLGSSKLAGDFIFGIRAGYTHSTAPLRASGGFRDVTFGQAVFGLRQNGNMSVSGMVTLANHKFSDLVPKFVLNFAAVR